MYDGSVVTDGLTNSGTISGSVNGVMVDGNAAAITGGLTNSGTIQGATRAIYVVSGGSIDSIVIAGDNTAKFIGKVEAPNTPVTVASGATYTLDNGNHFEVQGFTNAGTLKVGAGDTATVTGDFTNTGTFSPTVTDSGYGRVSVSGAVSLGGTLFVDASTLSDSNTYDGTISDVIFGGSSRTGTFASYSDNSTLFNLIPAYTSGGFDLTIASAAASGGPSTASIVAAAGNAPAAGAAAALDQIFTDAGNPITALFVPLTTDEQVNQAVTQTLPLLTGGSQIAAGAALTGINRVIQARQEANRGLSAGDSFYGDKKFWMKPFGSWADQDDRKGVSGYKAKTGGVAFGFDGTVSDKARLGASFAYARAKADSNSTIAPHTAHIDVFQLLGYGSYVLAPDTELNFQVGIGQNRNDGRRRLPAFGLEARAKYNSLVATAGVGLGKTLKLSETTSFTPSIRADYSWIKDKGYTETGAGALNLNVQSRTSDELIVLADGKFVHEYQSGSSFTANLGLGYDALAKPASITATYAGAPGVAFTTQGLDSSPWMLRGGLGLISHTRSGMEITARYDAEYRKDFLNQTASVKLRWAF